MTSLSDAKMDFYTRQGVASGQLNERQMAWFNGQPSRFDTLAAATTWAATATTGTKVVVAGHNGFGSGGSFLGEVQATADASYPGGGKIKPAGTAVTPLMWGATGDGTTDDTTAVNAAITFAEANDTELHLTKPHSVTTLDFDTDGLIVRQLHQGAGLIARSAAPVVRSLLANRQVANESLQNVKFIDVVIDGNSVATEGFLLERFTRGCGLFGCRITGTNGDGIDISESWSFSLEQVTSESNAARGFYLHGATNSARIEGCVSRFNGGRGVYIGDAQSGQITGNTFEYNKDGNFELGGKNVTCIGNYFEGIEETLSSVTKTCVYLGTSESPLLRSVFQNYVNGGSNAGQSVVGNGVDLVDVKECHIACSFALSTNYEFMFTETNECIGNVFYLSNDGHESDFTTPRIRNVTTDTTGGVEVLKGTNCYDNVQLDVAGTLGTRHRTQVRNTGSTGSVCEWTICYNGATKHRFGKLSSSSENFTFQAPSGAYFDFDNSVILPTMTTTERNNIASPPTGLVILNTTTGTVDWWNGSAWT